MDIPKRCEEIEDKVWAADRTMYDFLHEAGIQVSTWHRWKTGKSSPTMSKWTSVVAAEKKLKKQMKRAR